MSDLSQTSYACAPGGDFDVNQTKIKGGCQLERKVVPHDSKSDLPLAKQLRTPRKIMQVNLGHTTEYQIAYLLLLVTVHIQHSPVDNFF